MAYQNQFGQQGRFRETLKYEDIIHNQVESCREAFNRGDPTEIMYAVDALVDLISANIVDDDYTAELQDLSDEWEAEKAKMKKEYDRNVRLAQGGCPDLVDKPALKPGVEHFKRKFWIVRDLLERKNLGLKNTVSASD